LARRNSVARWTAASRLHNGGCCRCSRCGFVCRSLAEGPSASPERTLWHDGTALPSRLRLARCSWWMLPLFSRCGFLCRPLAEGPSASPERASCHDGKTVARQTTAGYLAGCLPSISGSCPCRGERERRMRDAPHSRQRLACRLAGCANGRRVPPSAAANGGLKPSLSHREWVVLLAEMSRGLCSPLPLGSQSQVPLGKRLSVARELSLFFSQPWTDLIPSVAVSRRPCLRNSWPLRTTVRSQAHLLFLVGCPRRVPGGSTWF
jgi:hypothetical protein